MDKVLICALILGAVGRVIYGTRNIKYWSLALLLPLGYFSALEGNVYAAGILSVGAWWTFNPGHGSYLDAGQSINPDNEFLAPLMRLLPFTDGTVLYDCVGLGLRYLLSTAFLAGVMTACNLGLGTEYNYWIAPYGALIGLFGWVKSWRAKEALIGAVTYGALALA